MKYEETIKYIEYMLEHKIMPGANVYLLDQNQEYSYSFGYQTYDQKDTLTKDSLFDLASVTKVVGTTTVILQLIEKQKLHLDDKVYQFLPIKSQKLQVKHLLTHTSDFQGYILNRNHLSADELTKSLLTKMQPGNNLGKIVKYSDINFLYLGWIAEKIAGQSIQNLITKNVLNKLTTNTFTFHPQGSIPTEKGLKNKVHDPKAQILGASCGSAGLFGSIEDMKIFTKMYLNNGQSAHNQILQLNTIKNLLHSYTDGLNQNRSLGWVFDHGNLTHTGYTGAYLSINPSTQQAFIFLSNRIYPSDENTKYLMYRDKLINIYHKEQ